MERGGEKEGRRGKGKKERHRQREINRESKHFTNLIQSYPIAPTKVPEGSRL